jgi:hypothetical protein
MVDIFLNLSRRSCLVLLNRGVCWLAWHDEVIQSKYTPGSFTSLHFTDRNGNNVRSKNIRYVGLQGIKPKGELSRILQCLDESVFA